MKAMRDTFGIDRAPWVQSVSLLRAGLEASSAYQIETALLTRSSPPPWIALYKSLSEVEFEQLQALQFKLCYSPVVISDPYETHPSELSNFHYEIISGIGWGVEATRRLSM